MPNISLHPVTISLHSSLVLHQARPWGVFRKVNDFYISDYTGPPFAFTDFRLVGLSGDDLCILPTGEYWRCQNGIVYTGTIGVDEVLGAESQCLGFAEEWVRSINAWKKNDDTYGMFYQWDADLNDTGIQGQIKQAASVDGITWTGHGTVLTAEICDYQELIYGSNQDMDSGSGSWETTDAYALEKLSVAVQNRYLRMFRIGRKFRYTTSGAFSNYEAWTALGDVAGILDDRIEFIEEAAFTVGAEDLTSGDIQILQVIRS